MTAWTFVSAAYLVTGLGTAGLLGWAWSSMRTAEGQADRLTRQP